MIDLNFVKSHINETWQNSSQSWVAHKLLLMMMEFQTQSIVYLNVDWQVTGVWQDVAICTADDGLRLSVPMGSNLTSQDCADEGSVQLLSNFNLFFHAGFHISSEEIETLPISVDYFDSSSHPPHLAPHFFSVFTKMYYTICIERLHHNVVKKFFFKLSWIFSIYGFIQGPTKWFLK